MLDLTQHEIGILLFLASTHLLWCTEEKPFISRYTTDWPYRPIMHVSHPISYSGLPQEPKMGMYKRIPILPRLHSINRSHTNEYNIQLNYRRCIGGAWNLIQLHQPIGTVGWMGPVNDNHKSKQKGRKEDLGRHEKDANERKINGPCKDNDSTFSSLSTILRERERLICKSNQ